MKIALKEIQSTCLFTSDASYEDPKLLKQIIEFAEPFQEIRNMIFFPRENIKNIIS